MKKMFSILLLAMMVVLPVNTFAETNQYVPNCVVDEGDLDGNVMICTVTVNTTGGSATKHEITLTENNATVDRNSIEVAAGSGWVLDPSSSFPTYTFTNTTGATGTYQLLTFTYTKNTSGDNCTIGVNGVPTSATPTKDVDTPTENKQTGVTLPYVFLGGALLIAGYAFIATKNKSKMYRL